MTRRSASPRVPPVLPGKGHNGGSVVVDAAGLVVPTEHLDSLKAAHRFYLKELLREALRLSYRGMGTEDCSPALYGLLRHATEKNSQALLECLSAPSVVSAMWCCAKQGRWPGFAGEIRESRRLMISNLLLEMAHKGVLPEGGASIAATCDLASPNVGAVLRCKVDAGGWRFKNGFVGAGTSPMLRLSSNTLAGRRPACGGISTEMGYVPIADAICLALVDLSPLARMEAHPDKAGNALSLGDRSEEDWRAAVDISVQWVHEYWRELYQEMSFLLRQIVPVGYDKDRHLSASYREAIGTIYTSLHPDPLMMTEALIHEFQHNKLNLVSYADPLLHNAFFPLFASPIRPDPRPLWGVLMGAHAFLPVAEYYRKMRAASHPAALTADFKKRLSEIDLKNRQAMETLQSHGRWTSAGEKVMGALLELQSRHGE